MKKILVILFFAFLVPENISACSCSGGTSPCGAYTEASAVFIGYVRKVEPEGPHKDEDGDDVDGGQVASVEIEKSFKGIKRSEVTLHQPGDNCTPKFKEGDRWLMYASYSAETKTWLVYGCGRSGPVSDTQDDLMYLYGLPKSATRTRLSGEIVQYTRDRAKGFEVAKRIAGAKVKITGATKKYEIYTDANGVYQITDLPAGTYLIEPEIPPGLKLDFPMAFGEVTDEEEEPSAKVGGKAVAVKLKERSCAGSDFILISDSMISGKVFDEQGQPVSGACVYLLFADGSNIGYLRTLDCTDKQGNYKLKEMPPGQYLVAVNEEQGPSGSSPYPRTYFPGIMEKEKATVITITEGTKLSDYDIHIPKRLATRTIEGRILFSSSLPLKKDQNPYVTFNAMEEDALNSGYAFTTPDERGRFTLHVLKDQGGWLHATVWVKAEDIPKCEATSKLLKGTESYQSMSFENKPVKIEPGDQDVQDIKLVIRVPSCDRDKPR